MKLVRFELHEEPGTARTGILHEGRLYETDGTNALGVHDLGKVAFLPAVGGAPSLRVFDLRDGTLEFSYGNPSRPLGTGAELVCADLLGLELRLRVGYVVKDEGETVDAEEAEGFLLGMLLTVEVVGLEGRSDYPWVFGPLLATLEDLPTVRWNTKVEIGGEQAYLGRATEATEFGTMLELASRHRSLMPGDLLVGPPLPLEGVRAVKTGDQLLIVVEGLGALDLKIV